MVLLPLCLSSFWPPLLRSLSFSHILSLNHLYQYTFASCINCYINPFCSISKTSISKRLETVQLLQYASMTLSGDVSHPGSLASLLSILSSSSGSFSLSASLCNAWSLSWSLPSRFSYPCFKCLVLFLSLFLWLNASAKSYNLILSFSLVPWFLFHHTLCRFDLSSWDSTRFSTTSQLLSRLHCPLTESQRRVSSLSCRVPSFHLSLSHRLSLFSHQFTVFSSSIPSCDWPGCQLIS